MVKGSWIPLFNALKCVSENIFEWVYNNVTHSTISEIYKRFRPRSEVPIEGEEIPPDDRFALWGDSYIL